MKKLKFKFAGLVLLFAFFYACDDSLDPKVDRGTAIGELLIENGGIEGKTLIKGVFNPDGNTYTFNDVPAETDLQNIKFNGQISLGAAPEFERYDFFKTNPQVVKVINREKSENYNVQLNILAPAMDPTIGRVEVTLEDGVTVVVGEVDETSKTLWLDAKKGEHVFVKSIAMLPKHTQYEFTKIQGTKILVEDPGVIKMDHMGRKSEYTIDFITIPPTGADFDKVRVIDFTKKENRYPNYLEAKTRGQASFDTDYVVVPLVDRVEYVPFASILAGNTNGKKESKAYTGVYEITNAFAFNGHYYSTPLIAWGSGGYTVRHWTDLSQDPSVTANYQVPARMGDGSTMQLDENGNGYIFSFKNTFDLLLRAKVTGYTKFDEYTTIERNLGVASPDGQLGHVYFNAVRDHSVYGGVGSLNEYTVLEANKLSLFDRDMASLASVENTVFASKLPNDSKNVYGVIFNFNKGRYLGIITRVRTGATPNGQLTLFDITNGDNTIDALKNFRDAPSDPVFTFDLGNYVYSGSAAYGGTISTVTDKTGEKLYIMAIAGNSGIVVLELPKKVDE